MAGCSKSSCKCDCAKCDGGFQAVLLRGGVTIDSPWVDRKGDYLRATLDLIRSNGPTLTVKVFTKPADGKGDGFEVDASTFIARTTPGRTTVEWSPSTGIGLSSLVRYQFSASTGGVTNPWLMFRMLSPVWFDSARVAAF